MRYSLAELCRIGLFEFIGVEGDMDFIKHVTGGTRYKSLGTRDSQPYERDNYK
jgi:hypothetical protein